MAESLALFLIEDEEDHALLMRKSLERAGHQVTVCRTGTDALIVLGHSPPFDLMILAQQLPDSAGLELMRDLQRAGITIPVIMVTGKSDQDLAIQVLRAGALDYIVKDDNLTYLAELPKRVTEAVARHRERKSMERQLFQAQKMQSVGTLAGGVAHEFNNLLAGIQGYATLGLREKGASEPVRELFQFIVNLSERAANLTRQLLAFARKPALSRQPTSIEKLLQSTAELVRSSLKIELDVEIDSPDPDNPLLALADANQLQQVLVNLALNARDAMPQPQPRAVAFRLRRRLLGGDLPAFPENVPAGDYVILEVEDYGSGMSSEVLSQALDPFFTTKEVGQGTGLGLPVVFGIVQGHQGFLTIDTEAGKGTRVRLYLPRLLDKHLPTTEAPAPPQVQEPANVPGRRILVIDDEEAVRDVVRRFLQIGGHHVSAATSGTEGLEVLEKEAIDLIILDLMVPREEGAANFRRVRQRFPSIPVLLCTGLVQADQAAICRGRACRLSRRQAVSNE